MGDNPQSSDEPDTAAERAATVGLGETVYNEEGESVGTVRGVRADGYFVTTSEGLEELSVDHARSTADFGEAELMWRCTRCGEMGDLDEGLPENCPSCGTEKEDLMYWTED